MLTVIFLTTENWNWMSLQCLHILQCLTWQGMYYSDWILWKCDLHSFSCLKWINNIYKNVNISQYMSIYVLTLYVSIYFLVFLALNSELVNITEKCNSNYCHLLQCKLWKIVRNSLKASNDPPVISNISRYLSRHFLWVKSW